MTASSTAVDGPDKHEKYWFEHGDLVLLVDNVYFKVHRDLLARTSGLIKEMLSMPVGADERAEGTTVDNAIVIPEVQYQHFELILGAAYGCFSPPNLSPPEVASEDYVDPVPDAVELLRAAHRLQAPSALVPLAAAVLGLLEPVQRFVLYRDLGLDEIRCRHEESHRAEQLRLYNALNARHDRRGVRYQSDSDFNVEPSKTAADMWLIEAFAAIVVALEIKMPSSELGDKTSMRIMVARERLIELRTSTVNKWIINRTSYGRSEVLCAANIWHLQRSTIDNWRSSCAYPCTHSMSSVIGNALPSAEEELAIIKNSWETVSM